MNLNGLVILEKYNVLRKIGEGLLSVVYLVEDEKNEKRQYALKILKSSNIHTPRLDIVRFSSEISIISRLSHPNIVKVIDSGIYNNHNFLIMEYIKGLSLDDILKSHKQLSIEDSISIIKQLATALDYIHSYNIIHRDIKPGNILLPVHNQNADYKNIKLIDFGLSHIADREHLEESDTIVGTFNYMAPEASGIINWSVDHRSDIYSMGVLFYQLLSGQLPFRGTSVANIIHEQIANQPLPFIKIAPEVPEILEKIVFKMIEKEPDNRYQTAAGIIHDLNQYLGGNNSFQPGKNEKIINPLHHTPVIGRNNQLQLLKNLFKEAEEGVGSFCLISGSAGTGKTRLGEELKETFYKSNGIFLNAKCYPAFSSIPYNPFWDILNSYIEIFRHKPQKIKEEISLKIRQAIGNLGSIVIKLNPQIKEILGECHDVIPLDPERERGRFFLVIGELFRVISEVEGVLVIQVDNLQWSDETSLLLLRELAFKIEEKSLLILGTYRDDEVETSLLHENLLSRVNDFNRFEEIKCELLQREEIAEFIHSAFRQDDQNTAELIEYAYRKCHGNPYFTIEIMREMLNSHIIFLEKDRWFFDKKRAEEIKISPRVVDVIIKRISLLENEERIILGCAAVIGRKFTVDLLFAVTSESKSILNNTKWQNRIVLENAILELIDKAVHMQIIEPGHQGSREMVFTHSRLYAELYHELADEERKLLHLYIAKFFENDNSEEHLFDIAHHYIHSNDTDKTIFYASTAGFSAAEKYANIEAIKYLSIAINSIEAKYISNNNMKYLDLWMKCKFRLGELYILIGELEKALSIFSEIIKNDSSLYSNAKVYRIMCRASFQMADWHSSEQYAVIGLKKLGEKLPVSKISVWISLVKQLFIHLIHGLFPKFYRMRKKKQVDDKEKLKMELYLVLSWMYILSDGIKFFRSVLRMLNLSESKIGLSKELGLSLASYASLCMTILLFERSERYHIQAIQIRKNLNDEWGLAQSYQWLAYGLEWQGRHRETNEYFIKSLEFFRKIGDVWEMGMCLGGMSYNAYSTSNYAQCMIYLREYLSISLKISDHFGLERSYDTYALCFIERGDYKSAKEYINEAHKVSIKHYLKFSLFFNYGVNGYLHLEEGNYKEAINILNKAIEMDNENIFIPFYTSFIYPLLAEAMLRQMMDGKRSRLVLSRLEIKNISIHINNALKKTKAWPGIYGISLMIKGMFCAINGNIHKSEIFFNKCISTLRETGRKYFLAKALMEYGTLLKEWGRGDESKEKLHESYDVFNEIGSVAYVSKVKELLETAKEKTSAMELNNSLFNLRLNEIKSLNRIISSLNDTDEVLHCIMDKVLEETGALRGYLFLKEIPDGEMVLKVKINRLSDETVQYSENILDIVLTSGEAIIAADAVSDRRFRSFQNIYYNNLKSILCVPVFNRNSIIGACYLDNPLKKGVFTDDDKNFVSLFMIRIVMVLENKFLYTNLEKTVNERTRELDIANKELEEAYVSVSRAFEIIKEDLAMAREVQLSILPREINRVGGLDIDLRFLPMSEVGGDIYDIQELKDGTIRIFVADATGHGVQAALITMAIISEYNKMKHIIQNPSDLLDRLNRILFNLYGDIRIIFSCIIADLHIKDKKIVYASAGHPAQYIIRKDEIIELERTGRIVGLVDGSVFESKEQTIQKGDKILFFTDGFYEHLNNDRLPYGQDRLKNVLFESYSESINTIIDIIFDDIENFLRYVKKANDDDDVTVIGITIK